MTIIQIKNKKYDILGVYKNTDDRTLFEAVSNKDHVLIGFDLNLYDFETIKENGWQKVYKNKVVENEIFCLKFITRENKSTQQDSIWD